MFEISFTLFWQLRSRPVLGEYRWFSKRMSVLKFIAKQHFCI